MNIFIIFERAKNKLMKIYREYIFKCRTGQSVNLVKNVIIINTNVKLGKNVTFYPDVMLFGDGLIEIGDNVDIGNGTIIYSSRTGGVKIGNNSIIAAQSYIIDADHGIQHGTLIQNQLNSVSPVIIGEDVWIGANCTILKGAIIHDGAVIGAKSLVNGEIPTNMIAVGIPAKAVKQRK